MRQAASDLAHGPDVDAEVERRPVTAPLQDANRVKNVTSRDVIARKLGSRHCGLR